MANKQETLAQEFSRIVSEYRETDADGTRGDALNLIADFAESNMDAIASALNGVRPAAAGKMEEAKLYHSQWPKEDLLKARSPGGLFTDNGEAWRYRYTHSDAQGGPYDLVHRPDVQPAELRVAESHQQRVAEWMQECFGAEIAADKVERVDRFIEEALELAQATGWTPDRAQALVDYVFARPAGEIGQEIGGVMVTLAALCEPYGYDMDIEAKSEVDRITQPDVIAKIRKKQAGKPTGSALPSAMPGHSASASSSEAPNGNRRRMLECNDVDCQHDRERKMVPINPKGCADPCIAGVVQALNDGGYTTVASCCGHGYRNGTIVLADGRELLIARNFVEARAMELVQTQDINGAHVDQPARVGWAAEDKRMILLRIINAMPGRETGSGDGNDWLHWFCDDGEPDTFNACHEAGWLATSHDPDTSNSITRLTKAGCEALTPAPSSEAPQEWECKDFVHDPCGSARCANCGRRNWAHKNDAFYDPKRTRAPSSEAPGHEMIEIDGKQYRRFIPYPEEVDDGTLRCIRCGQIDDEPWHDMELCRASMAPIVSHETPSRETQADLSVTDETQGDRCDVCHRVYAAVYSVPNALWPKIAPHPETLGSHPEHQGGGLLCPDCARTRAQKIGVRLNFEGVIERWGEVATPEPTGLDVMALLRFEAREGYSYQSGKDTNAPAIVYADADYEEGDGTCGLHATVKSANEPAIVYVRADALEAAQARIAEVEKANRWWEARAEQAERERNEEQLAQLDLEQQLDVAKQGWRVETSRADEEKRRAEAAHRNFLSAWDAIPDGKHTWSRLQSWITHTLKPAAERARAALASNGEGR